MQMDAFEMLDIINEGNKLLIELEEELKEFTNIQTIIKNI